MISNYPISHFFDKIDLEQQKHLCRLTKILENRPDFLTFSGNQMKACEVYCSMKVTRGRGVVLELKHPPQLYKLYSKMENWIWVFLGRYVCQGKSDLVLHDV